MRLHVEVGASVTDQGEELKTRERDFPGGPVVKHNDFTQKDNQILTQSSDPGRHFKYAGPWSAQIFLRSCSTILLFKYTNALM